MDGLCHGKSHLMDDFGGYPPMDFRTAPPSPHFRLRQDLKTVAEELVCKGRSALHGESPSKAWVFSAGCGAFSAGNGGN